MRNMNFRRGLALLGAAVAAVGVLAVAQPVNAEPKGSSSPNAAGSAAAPAAVVVAGRGAAADKTTAREGGVSLLHLDGACNQYSDGTGDLCLWWFQNYTGSRADFYFADSNLNDNVFITAGSGQGSPVGNLSESDWNYDLIYGARVCTGINGAGTCGTVPPGSGGNFNSTYRNNVESFTWV
ncbi:hypothetical protein WEI85_10450 [Actinomycetes bacterium KLBMP 9797]